MIFRWMITLATVTSTRGLVLVTRRVVWMSSSLETVLKTRGVTVFTTKGCPHCQRAKRYLREHGVSYSEVDVRESRKALTAMSGATSVPQVYVATELVGGADQLESSIRDGSLDALLEQFGITKGFAVVEESDAPPFVPGLALNDIDTLDVAAELQQRALELVDAYVTDSGVDYRGMRGSAAFRSFVSATVDLRRLERLDALDDAFWINLYNALVLHANVVLGPPADDPAARAEFFGRDARYIVGPTELTLDDIEHGILRRSPPEDPRAILDEDRRKFLGLDSKPAFDCRIHFALNCGARSCPPIKIFSSDTLEEDLALAGRAFVEAETYVLGNDIELSRLFLWYRRDFTDAADDDDRSLVAAIRTLLPEDNSSLGKQLDALLAQDKLRVRFRSYDWSQNSAERPQVGSADPI